MVWTIFGVEIYELVRPTFPSSGTTLLETSSDSKIFVELSNYDSYKFLNLA